MELVLIQAVMASGITVTSNPDPAQIESLGVSSWPIWGCEVSTFPWTYADQETCLLLEGDVTVTPDGGEPVRFGAGDLVVFDARLGAPGRFMPQCASTTSLVERCRQSGADADTSPVHTARNHRGNGAQHRPGAG